VTNWPEITAWRCTAGSRITFDCKSDTQLTMSSCI